MDDPDFETEVPVRFRDVDALGHVNNAVFATYMEQARTDYVREVIGEPITDAGMVVASISIDFRQPITLNRTVSVSLSVTDIGESSFRMEYEIVGEDGEVAATGETVQVAIDPETERSRPIPDAWRERIAGD